MRFVSTLLCLLMLSLGLQAQTTDNNQKGKKSLVSVPVAVSDREGRYISDLKKDDFSIFQDGKEQKIELFATEDEPISVALLLDTSESTKGVLDKIRLAAKDFIELLNNKDKCLVATFDSEVKVLSRFTSDRDALEKSLDKIQTGEREGTVVFSAVEKIAREHFVKIPGRKIIILLSDGKDYGSSISKNNLFNQLEESDIMIYSIFYQTGKVFVDSTGAVKAEPETKKPEIKEPEIKEPETKKPPKKKKKRYSIKIALPRDPNTTEEITLIDKVTSTEAVNVLQEMSATTAGRFYMSDAPKLSQIFKKIAAEVREQYRLGFYPKDVVNDAAFNEIIVKVNRPDAVVRARGKYRAKQL
jgi:VWFA-related protein